MSGLLLWQDFQIQRLSVPLGVSGRRSRQHSSSAWSWGSWQSLKEFVIILSLPSSGGDFAASPWPGAAFVWGRPNFGVSTSSARSSTLLTSQQRPVFKKVRGVFSRQCVGYHSFWGRGYSAKSLVPSWPWGGDTPFLTNWNLELVLGPVLVPVSWS